MQSAELENKDLFIKLDDLSEFCRQACKRMNWGQLMPVQSRAIPYILAERDVMVQSKTGSGKTGAYLLPALEKIDVTLKQCQVLVLVPTRELALQVYNEALAMTADSELILAAAYGGVGYKKQLDALQAGAQLVVGTPGRILDHLLRQSLGLDSLRLLVLDEADRMLSMGFYPDMKQVQSYLPRRKVLTALFSATYPPQVLRLTDEFLREPQVLSLSTDHVHVTETEHVYYEIPGMEKDRALVRVIEAENPVSAIIFCNTKENVRYVNIVLNRFGYDAHELSSGLSQSKRERVLGRLRAGNLRFLVATDVAARGIDIPELSHVIQYEPPEDPEVYVHRAGRTGRAGACGKAITLVNIMEELKLKDIGRRFRVPLQKLQLPEQEEIQTVVGQRIIAALEAKLRAKDLLEQERIDNFEALVATLTESREQRLLLAMLLDDFYLSMLQSQLSTPQQKVSEQKKRRPRKRRRKPKNTQTQAKSSQADSE